MSECLTDVVATWYDVLAVAATNGHVLGTREGGEDGLATITILVI
jgi:hypothetical protein